MIRLASATAQARSFGMDGHAITTVRGHHALIDAPLMLGGPNEGFTPIDLLLSALAAQAVFFCHRVAQERKIPLQSVHASVSGTFDPRAMTGEPCDPTLQTIRLRLAVLGATEDQVRLMTEAIKTRCPIYATLVRAVPILIETALGDSFDSARDTVTIEKPQPAAE